MIMKWIVYLIAVSLRIIAMITKMGDCLVYLGKWIRATVIKVDYRGAGEKRWRKE